MNTRFIITMGISIIALAIGFSLLYDVQQENQNENTQTDLDTKLQESNNRLSIVKNEFYNGKYNGDLPIEEVIKIINEEIEIQEKLLEQYKQLPIDSKTDKTIDRRFFQLGKYSWAGEKSMLQSLENSK